jgi:DNA transformation protein
MSTQKETVEFILEKIGRSKHFSTRAMFGEYALYADGRVVALICDDQLYVKILPASEELENLCEKDTPYPGARPHYLVEESQLGKIENLSEILLNISKSLPPKKEKKSKKTN